MASVLCFGDSITQGYVDLGGGWTQRLRRRLDRDATIPMGATTFPAHAVFNLGVSGDTAEGCWPGWNPSWARAGSATRPSSGSTRPPSTSGPAEPRTTPRRGQDTAAAWSPDGAESHANERIAAFNQAVRRVAAEGGAALVDCFDEMLAGDHAALLHDGLHPNGAGHQLLADRIGERPAPWL